MTLAILATLSAIAVGSFLFFRSETENRGAEGTLLTVAAAQESYYLSRGRWAAGGALDALGGGPGLTSGVSTGTGTVSVQAKDVDGVAALGLAVLGSPGECVLLLVLPPEEQYSAEIRRVDVTGGESCKGEDAW